MKDAKAFAASQAGFDITFRSLEKDSVGMLLEIQEEAFAVLDDPDLLRRNTAQTLECCFSERSLVLGAYCRGEIAGFGILYDAGQDEENLAKELDECDDITQYVNAKLIIVRPKFRGLGIQRMLIERMVAFAKANGFKGVLATVSPKNNYSSANLERCGFEAVKSIVKYGGKERILYFKVLGE